MKHLLMGFFGASGLMMLAFAFPTNPTPMAQPTRVTNYIILNVTNWVYPKATNYISFTNLSISSINVKDMYISKVVTN